MIERETKTASIIGRDLTVVGNIESDGSVKVEGTVEGDIRAKLVSVLEDAKVLGEIISEDIVVSGSVSGRVRGLKVRLTSGARVEGDIIHKTIAIESGAHFEGSVRRVDDPLEGVTFSETAAFEVSVNLNSDENDQLDNLADATKALMNFLGYELEPGPSGGIPESSKSEDDFQLGRQNVA
jgi:cytoskeletal protein CcmA (bactofilin family)